MGQEIELKLELEGGTDVLPAAETLFGGEGKLVRQRSVYFDTPDHWLHDHGLSLRIRRTARKRVQTIKRESAAGGLIARDEEEMAVDGDSPVVAGTALARRLKGRVNALAPLFETWIDRRLWVLDGVEAVVDQGTVRADGRRTPVAEVELELKGGALPSLFDLARRLDALVPVRLGVLSKAERGYELIGPARTMYKAERVDLAPDMNVADAFRAVALNCLRHYRRNEAVLLARRDADALHQARVALRRLRSAFTLFGPLLDDPRSDTLKQSLRSAAATLGKARNLDVLLGRLPADSGAARTRIERGREAAYDGVDTMLASAGMRGLMIDLAGWLQIGEWTDARGTGDSARAFAAAALDRRMKQVKKRGKHLKEAGDTALHALRKEAKKLRYASEFFVAYYAKGGQGRRHRRFVKILETLQDQLGLLNDLATAPEVFDELGIESPPPHGKLDRDRLVARAAKAYARLIEAEPFWD